MPQTTITDIGTVGIPVSDQDKALEFFTSTLGFGPPDRRILILNGPTSQLTSPQT